MSKTFEQITTEMADLYKKKNSDYGDSFSQSLNEDGLIVSKIRLGDKYKRFCNLIKKPITCVKDESIQDTLIDMANYCVMTLLWMENNER